MQLRALSIAALIISCPPAALADESAWRRCRKVANPEQRLACYDAVVIQAAASAPPRARVEEFGLAVQPPGGDLEFIESSLEEEVDGWRGNARFRLSNGQVWQVADDSIGHVHPATRKVRIRRGALGAYFLELEGTHRSPRVRRIQ